MSTVIKVVKEKNLLNYYLDDKTVPYVIDLNSGKVYGLSGKQIISIPSPISQYMNSFRYFENDNYSGFLRSFIHCTTSMSHLPKVWLRKTDELIAYDRLIAVGYTPAELDSRWCRDNLVKLVKYIKHFAKLKAERGGIQIDLNVEYHNYIKAIWLKENGLDDNRYFNPAMCEMCRDLRLTPEQIKLVYSWCIEGLSALPMNHWVIKDMIRTIFNYSECINYTLTKGNFLKQHRDVITMYNDMKEEIENRKFLESQMKHIKALNFETDDYIVVVPTKCNDLVIEGKKQNNCVGGYVSSVINQSCNIVFIRKKSDIENSYITCEIRNGTMWQTLLKFNRRLTEESDNEFCRLYQEHLRALWNVGE